MKALLTARTEIDHLRGIDWFDRVSIGLGELFEAEFYLALESRITIACTGVAGRSFF